MVCALDNNKFAVSVADAMLFDTSCAGEQLIMYAKTLINSSITQAIQSTTIYGGKGSKAEFEFNYQKELTVTLEDSVFSPVYLAAQNGTKLVNEVTQIYTSEDVTFDSAGVATLKGTPTGNVQVALADGTYKVVVATGQTITVPELADTEGSVVYPESKNLNVINIDADTFPKSLKLVLIVDIHDNYGLAEQMYITINKFKPDGAMEISLTHDGVATSSLSGKALADCNRYATIAFNKVDRDGDNCPPVELFSNPTYVELDISAVQPDTEQLTITGVDAQGRPVTLDPTGLTFTSADPTVATVDASGLVSLVATATGSTSITVDYVKDGVTLTLTVPVTVA